MIKPRDPKPNPEVVRLTLGLYQRVARKLYRWYVDGECTDAAEYVGKMVARSDKLLHCGELGTLEVCQFLGLKAMAHDATARLLSVSEASGIWGYPWRLYEHHLMADWMVGGLKLQRSKLDAVL